MRPNLRISTATPQPVGTAAAGTSLLPAAGDHSHAPGGGSGLVLHTGSSTAAQIQASLNDAAVKGVLLEGTINLGTTALSVPARKCLLGAGGGRVPTGGSSPVIIQYSGSGNAITGNEFSWLRGFRVEKTGTPSQGVGVLMLKGSVVEDIETQLFATGFEDSGEWMGRLFNCVAQACATGFLISKTVSATIQGFCHFDKCAAIACTSHGFNVNFKGSSSSHVMMVFNACLAQGCGGAGFRQNGAWGSASGSGHVELMHCMAFGNTGDGFDLDASTHSQTQIAGCRAISNGGVGFIVGGSASAPRQSFAYSNYSQNNTGGGYTGFGAPWLIVNNN